MCLNKLKCFLKCKSVPIRASKCTGCKRLWGKTTAYPVGQDSFKTNLAGTEQAGLAPCPFTFALMLSVLTEGPRRDLQLTSSHTWSFPFSFTLLGFFCLKHIHILSSLFFPVLLAAIFSLIYTIPIKMVKICYCYFFYILIWTFNCFTFLVLKAFLLIILLVILWIIILI